jgi:hypothetical protein
MLTDTTSRRRDPTPLLDPLQVKIELLKRGISLNRWAEQHGVNRMAAWRAVMHGARGPASRRIAQDLQRELGL